MVKRNYWVALFLLPALYGQDNSGVSPNASSSSWGTKTIQLKYLDPDELRQVFSGRSYVMEVNRNLKLLTVSGPTEFLTEVEQAGKRLDLAPTPPANIEVTVYLLATTGQTSSAQSLPAEMQGIDRSLGSTASSLHLVDSETLRVREGKTADVSFADSASSGLAWHLSVFRLLPLFLAPKAM